MIQKSLVARLSGNRLIRLAAFAVLGFAAGQLGLSFARVNGWMPASALSDALLFLSSCLTCAGAAYAARASMLDKRTQRGWLLIAGGYVIYAAGSLTDFALQVISSQDILLSFADSFYMLALVLLCLGVVNLAGRNTTRGEFARVVLDVSVIMLSTTLLIWVGVIAPWLMANRNADLATRGFVLIYPIFELMVLFAVLYLLFSRRGPVSALTVYLIVGGLAVQIVAEIAFAILSLHNEYASGDWLDVGFLLANGLVLLAGLVQAVTAREPSSADAEPQARPRWTQYLPYIWVVVAYGLLIAQVADWVLIPFPVIALVVGIIIGLVLLRQIITLNENQRLYVAAQQEIKERQIAENSLLNLAKALETMNLGVTIADPQGIIIYTNPVNAQMHGYTVRELLGKPVSVFSLDPQLDAAEKTMLRHWGSWQREQMNVRKDGSLFPAQLVSDAVVDAHDQVIGIVTTCQDITERRQAQAALQLAKQELETRVAERTAELQIAKRQLEHLLSVSPSMIYRTEPADSTVPTFVSANVQTLTGFSPQEFIEQPTFWRDHVHPDDVAQLAQRQMVLQQQELFCDYRFKHRDGHYRWVRDRLKVVRNADGQPIEIVGAWVDISINKRAEERQRILYETLRAVSARLDVSGVVQSAADTIARIANYPHVCIALPDKPKSHWVVQGAAGKLAATVGATYAVHQGIIGRCFQTGKMQWVHDVLADPGYVRDVQNADAPALRSEIVVPLNYNERMLGALNIESEHAGAFDVDDVAMIEALGEVIALSVEHARLYEQVQLLAVTDELTGIYNRRGFFELAGREFERARRYGRPLSLVMFDIDHFKRVNDQYTHAAGDILLRDIAQRAQKNARHFDILGRYGGEEFVWLLPETDLVTAYEAAERLRQAIQEMSVLLKPGQPTVMVTISLGVAALTPDIFDLAEMVNRADQAMLRAKNAGRNRIESVVPGHST